MSAVKTIEVDIERLSHLSSGKTCALELTLTQAIDLRDAADKLVEEWDKEEPKFCRFCKASITGESIASTDGKRSHPNCYHQWVKQMLAEIA